MALVWQQEFLFFESSACSRAPAPTPGSTSCSRMSKLGHVGSNSTMSLCENSVHPYPQNHSPDIIKVPKVEILKTEIPKIVTPMGEKKKAV